MTTKDSLPPLYPPTSSNVHEKRRYVRLACPTAVVVRREPDGPPHESRGANISHGGLRFFSPVAYEVGTKLLVEVKARAWEGLTTQFDSLHAEIVVRRSGASAEGFDIAGEFLSMR